MTVNRPSTAEPKGSRRRRSRQVLVAGDVTMGWNIARVAKLPDDGFVWNLNDKAEIYYEPGGAVLLAKLLRLVARGLSSDGPTISVHEHERFVIPSHHDADGYHHSYSLWKQFPRSVAPDEHGSMVWRLEEVLGFRGHRDARRVPNPTPRSRPEIVVIADTGLGFREASDRWPQIHQAESERRPWILLKTKAPLADGPLWEHLVSNHADRLVVVFAMNELRLSEVRIGHGVSWEGIAADVVRQIVRHHALHALAACAHVVISIGTGGAIVISKDPDAPNQGPWEESVADLVFDPESLGSRWVEKYEGKMVGYASCLTAAIVRELMLARGGAPDILEGVRRGLSAGRALHLEGFRRGKRLYRKASARDGEDGDASPSDSPRTQLRFPVDVVSRELNRARSAPGVAPCDFAVVRISDTEVTETTVAKESWTILQTLYPDDPRPLADAVARLGPEVALEGVPIGRFGNLVTVDRGEIEGFRSIADTMREYAARPSTQPLCIGVFGPPGAGKSFAVTAVANDSLAKQKVVELSFNVSQMRDPSELVDALHQVRDCGLKGNLPFVFWDEFDSDLNGIPLGWLRFFLAPMEDGVFIDRQVAHPIGNAIFAFAGGTTNTLAEFNRQEDKQFRRRKGPDFVSRLKGHVDIVGINPRPDPLTLFDSVTEPDDREDRDPYYRIRRAILLRAILWRKRPNLFAGQVSSGRLHIDEGVLRAFLGVNRYTYGARSLESLVAMSSLYQKAKFDRSALPVADQMKVHVSSDFLAEAEGYVPRGPKFEVLAAAVHAARRRELDRCDGVVEEYLAGHRLIPPFGGPRRPSGMLPERVEYGDLEGRYQEQNRAVARDIPQELMRLGFWVQQSADAGGQSRVVDLGDHRVVDYAKAQHATWYRRRIRIGWEYGANLDLHHLKHPHVRPWDELTPAQKKKDLKLARDLAQVAIGGGMAIVPPKFDIDVLEE